MARLRSIGCGAGLGDGLAHDAPVHLTGQHDVGTLGKPPSTLVRRSDHRRDHDDRRDTDRSQPGPDAHEPSVRSSPAASPMNSIRTIGP